MRNKLLIIGIILLTSVVIKGQEIDKGKILKELRSEDEVVRIKAVGMVIENNIIEALGIIEEEYDKQELRNKPLYLEAMKKLGSKKIEEKITEYIRNIEQKSREKGEIIREGEMKNMVEWNKEYLERKDREEQKK
ncbi:MAG: hypothetical protein QHH13_12315 [Melioribacter sp.]|uniref:hypothetical protein n=1 Tax=Rosettibacter primus TaxID=3111523 RepID=UPI00247E98B2|nr:hypothetical protein [Melioribacter sp.]